MINVTKNFHREKTVLIYLLSSIFLLIMIDLSLDLLKGKPFAEMTFDIMLEVGILTITLLTTYYIWKKFIREKQCKESIARDLQTTKIQSNLWEKKSNNFIKEFQSHILSEFSAWNLSKSEREIAILLLKGKSSKEISQVRFTSERTIRNQCRAIYEKSEVKGKSEFSANFLKDLIRDIT